MAATAKGTARVRSHQLFYPPPSLAFSFSFSFLVGLNILALISFLFSNPFRMSSLYLSRILSYPS